MGRLKSGRDFRGYFSRKDAKGKADLMTKNEIGKWLANVAIQIHREIGPRLLEIVCSRVIS